MNQLWRQLLTDGVLKRGWHLARLDTRNDFAEDLYATDAYGLDLEQNVQESINRIRTGRWQPRPLFRMEVPKGSLSFRPGSVIPIQDRVIASAIIYLMAPLLDSKLPDGVYSWRVKKPFPKKGALFRENEVKS